MAKSNKPKATAKVVAKPAKSAAAPRVEVEIDEERKPAGMEAGIAITTTILLLVAILLIDRSLGGYGAGMFFK